MCEHDRNDDGGTKNSDIPASETSIKAFFTKILEQETYREIVSIKVQELVNEDDNVAKTPEFVHLGHCLWENVGQVVSPTYFAMMLCRKFNILPSERSVLLPLADQYQAIQLCLAKINKKKHGDFYAAVSDVLDVWNELYQASVKGNETSVSLIHDQQENDDSEDGLDLILPSRRRESYDPVVRETQEIVNSYLEFLQTTGCIDHFSVFSALRKHVKDKNVAEYISSKTYIVEGVSQMPTMEREILKLLLGDAHVSKITLEAPSTHETTLSLEMSGIGEDALNDSTVKPDSDIWENVCDDLSSPEDTTTLVVAEELELTVEEYIEEMPRSPNTPDLSDSEMYVEQLIMAHLRLLINTRDELALAVLCSMPGREITQKGFYGIKDAAEKKKMPMYQTILSFIMRLRLGGKGYQVDANCPFLPYSKPLGEFVDSMMKLQNIVEEEPDERKAAVRILSMIKSNLMRIRGRSLKSSCIEKVWDSLYSAFVRLTSEPENEAATSKGKLQQTTGALRPCLKLLLELCDEASGRIPDEIVDVLGENFLTQCNSSKKTATPVRIPSVLSLFRSPVQGSPLQTSINENQDCGSSLKMRLMMRKSTTPKNTIAPRFKSGCSWAPDDLSPISTGKKNVDKTLSPIVGPTLKAVGHSNSRLSSEYWKDIVESVVTEEEEIRKENESLVIKNVKKSITQEKRSKRSLLSDISNIKENSSSKGVKGSDERKSPVKKKTKTKAQPVLKGQKSITSFFKK